MGFLTNDVVKVSAKTKLGVVIFTIAVFCGQNIGFGEFYEYELRIGQVIFYALLDLATNENLHGFEHDKIAENIVQY